jgi:hypothetical protein
MLETLSVCEIECVIGRKSLSNQSPPIVSAKREYSRARPETFCYFHLSSANRESGDEINARKAGISGLFSRFLGSLAEL